MTFVQEEYGRSDGGNMNDCQMARGRARASVCDMTASPTRQLTEPTQRTTQVMIVDEHARVRHGLRVFLSTCTDLAVVAEAGSGPEALQRFAETHPQVVVMDLTTPEMDGPIVTRRMKELDPSVQIIVLASYCNPETERRALDAGALCCVVKDSSAAALVEAIRRAHPGICIAKRSAHMTFVQANTGGSAEGESGVPSDVTGPAAIYHSLVSTSDKPATGEVRVTARR
jgi:DNA-binding NarL/FixJ family response regulator